MVYKVTNVTMYHFSIYLFQCSIKSNLNNIACFIIDYSKICDYIHLLNNKRNIIKSDY